MLSRDRSIAYEPSIQIAGLVEGVPSMRKKLVTWVDRRIVIHL